MAARNPATGGKRSSRGLEFVANVGPYVFIVGLVCALAMLLTSLASLPSLTAKIALPIAAVGFFSALIWRFDVNRMAMHAFYRNRLTRCYLGASNERRNADKFTGFDTHDDLPLAGLDIEHGPFPIINAALNLNAGAELAWQERRAASFTLTPLHCGFEFPEVEGEIPESAYRRTIEYADETGLRSARVPKGQQGVLLSTCMATSGAAASPNMGYHSTPSLAFLMTVFNVRLGWWAGNPNHASAWQEPGPGGGIKYLVSELLGMTTATSDFVYLSDGGHFDNLGIYELVRRRCPFILASDAGADGDFSFDDLGNVVRKCRADFGVQIDIDVARLSKDAASGYSRRHVAVGTITYPGEHGSRRHGVLVYLKPTLLGMEPADVRNYAARNPAFPHQSTGDQWFDESQFESYRKLGCHVALNAIEPVWAALRQEREPGLAGLFSALRQRWHPHSSATAASFTKHGEALDDLFRRLRSDPDLAFLDHQFYPEWARYIAGAKPKPVAGGAAKAKSDRSEARTQADVAWLPLWAEERRDAFYFCNSLFQLMENVYIDLHLEHEYDHPDNSGWMNLFRHWTWGSMFRIAWAISGATYGRRFRWFCRRRLGLVPGELVVSERDVWGGSTAKTVRGRCQRLEQTLETLEKEGELNFYEVKLIKEFFAYNEHMIGNEDARIQLMQIHVVDVRGKNEPFRFTCGFALTLGTRIVMLRIQDHLRLMGHGWASVHALNEALGEASIADVRTPQEWAEADAGLAVLEAQFPDVPWRVLQVQEDYEKFIRILKLRRTSMSESQEEALVRMKEMEAKRLYWPVSDPGAKAERRPVSAARKRLTDDPYEVDGAWEGAPEHLTRMLRMLFTAQAASEAMQAQEEAEGPTT